MLYTPVALVVNHALESLEDLNRCLETDGSRFRGSPRHALH